MDRIKEDLNSAIDFRKWQEVQDRLAEAVGLSIMTVDYMGNAVTDISCGAAFCHEVRKNPYYKNRCLKCDSLAGLEAIRRGKPLIYVCHFGVIDAAVPIVVGNRYLGAVMLGGARLTGSDADKAERIVSEVSLLADEECSCVEHAAEYYESIPVRTYEHIERSAELVSSLIRYIIELHSSLLAAAAASGNAVTQTKAAIDEMLPEQETTGKAPYEIRRSSPIYPAIRYIENNIGSQIKMSDMAALCNFSTSYFSRIFIRVVGERFTEYITRRKIETAKVMLTETDTSIYQIAFNLGFIDPSYFIKQFKKYTGTTPKQYRLNN